MPNDIRDQPLQGEMHLLEAELPEPFRFLGGSGVHSPQDPQLAYGMSIPLAWSALHGFPPEEVYQYPSVWQGYPHPLYYQQQVGVFDELVSTPPSPPLVTPTTSLYEQASSLSLTLSPDSTLFSLDQAAAPLAPSEAEYRLPMYSSDVSFGQEDITIQTSTACKAVHRRKKTSASTSKKDDSGTREKKKCMNCGATKTPTWRRGPHTRRLLCNACGLYEKVSGRKRTVVVKDGKTRIHRWSSHNKTDGGNSHPFVCSACDSTEAKRWHIVHERCFCDKCAWQSPAAAEVANCIQL